MFAVYLGWLCFWKFACTLVSSVVDHKWSFYGCISRKGEREHNGREERKGDAVAYEDVLEKLGEVNEYLANLRKADSQSQ